MVILHPLRRLLAQTKPIQHIILQQQILIPVAPKHGLGRRIDPVAQLFLMAGQHELEQLSHALGVLADLPLGVGVEDGEACVDMPLVAVDAQRHVDLDVLDAAHVARDLPGKLRVGVPGGAHRQEGGVRDGLRVGRDAVVLGGRQVDVLGVQAGQDALDQLEGRVGGAVLDQDERLPFGIDAGPVERVDGNDLDVGREVLLEGGNFGGFARGLPADDGTELGSCDWED